MYLNFSFNFSSFNESMVSSIDKADVINSYDIVTQICHNTSNAFIWGVILTLLLYFLSNNFIQSLIPQSKVRDRIINIIDDLAIGLLIFTIILSWINLSIKQKIFVILTMFLGISSFIKWCITKWQSSGQ